MRKAIDETERRRAVQQAFNEKHGITPKTVHRKVKDGIQADAQARKSVSDAIVESEKPDLEYIEELRSEMLAAAENMEFERAASIRDRLAALEEGEPVGAGKKKARSGAGNQRRGRKKGRRGTASRIPKPKGR